MTNHIPFKLISFSQPQAIEAVQSLSPQGILHIRDHYCYLKVDDLFIHNAFKPLCTHFKMQKPQYFPPEDTVGAHISVIYPEEHTLPHAQFAGQSHTFQVSGLIKAHYGEQIYYGFSVEAPTLAQIRKQHGLQEKPIFKEQTILFHITVGVFKPNDYK